VHDTSTADAVTESGVYVHADGPTRITLHRFDVPPDVGGGRHYRPGRVPAVVTAP